MTNVSDSDVELLDDAPFSKLIRSRTWSAHEQAETTGFMQALLEGRLPVTAYADMTGQLSLVYEVIEGAEVLGHDDIARQFSFDELSRRDAFRADLDFLLGTDRPPAEPLPATARYLERLNEVCASWNGGYVAHHYTRFMGDLSGGQMIRVALQRAFGFAGSEGVESLTFDRITDRNAFKTEYRRRLDALPWSRDEQERVVDEILLAYRGNTEIISDLGARYRSAIEG